MSTADIYVEFIRFCPSKQRLLIFELFFDAPTIIQYLQRACQTRRTPARTDHIET